MAQTELINLRSFVKTSATRDWPSAWFPMIDRMSKWINYRDDFSGVLPDASGSFWDLDVEASGNGTNVRQCARGKIQTSTSASTPTANDTTVVYAESGGCIGTSDWTNENDTIVTYVVNTPNINSVILAFGLGSNETTDALARYGGGADPTTLSIGAAGAGLTDANIVRFEYDTALAQANWNAVAVIEGVFAGRLDLGVKLVTNRTYILTLAVINRVPHFFIDGEYRGSINTTISATGASATRYLPFWGVTTLTGAVRAVKLLHVDVMKQLSDIP